MSVKLCIPDEVLKQHMVVLGKTGKGKSSVLRHMVEHLLEHKKRVCVIDPKGDWWGLKVGSDGRSAGYPVILFGDFKAGRKGDVPVNPHSARDVASLVASGNRPCVIGFNGWTRADMLQFWINFAAAIFSLNAGELYIVGDEFHNFAPKGKVLDPRSGESLHWSNRLLSEGRGIGLVCLIASQRPQKVHNDTLTSCETLIAMGVIHAADRQAVKDWIDGCGDKEKGAEVLNTIAGLQRGEGWVWSPEIDFGPKLIQFPMFTTFDSFAPPQLQKKVSEAGWAAVNLDEVKSKLAKVVEEAKANDPGELKREIAALRKERDTLKRGLQAEKPVQIKTQIHEVPVLKDQQVQALTRAATALMEYGAAVAKQGSDILEAIKQVGLIKRPQAPAAAPRPIPSHHAPVALAEPREASADGMDSAKQKILDVVAMLGARGLQANRDMIAAWLDIHPNGGRYGANLAWLRENGFLDGCELTDAGLAQARTMTTGIEAAKAVLDGAHQKIFSALEGEGAELSRDELASVLQIHPNGGRFGANLARLRSMGLIPERGTIKLTEAAFR